MIETLSKTLKPSDPLAGLEGLERAAKKGWLLTSAQVQLLTGCKPCCRKGESEFVRGTFAFIKSGKIGGSLAWKVVKRGET